MISANRKLSYDDFHPDQHRSDQFFHRRQCRKELWRRTPLIRPAIECFTEYGLRQIFCIASVFFPTAGTELTYRHLALLMQIFDGRNRCFKQINIIHLHIDGGVNITA